MRELWRVGALARDDGLAHAGADHRTMLLQNDSWSAQTVRHRRAQEQG